MGDKQPMQAAGEGGPGKSGATQPDGVNSAGPDGDQGGPYPNRVTGGETGGFFGHGGQTDIDYSGSEEGEKRNAATE